MEVTKAQDRLTAVIKGYEISFMWLAWVVEKRHPVNFPQGCWTLTLKPNLEGCKQCTGVCVCLPEISLLGLV